MNIELQNRTFLFCFGKDFSSYRQNSCCCDTADIPRHPSNVRYIAFITLDIWWFWCMIGSQWFVKMLQVYGPTRSMKVIESAPLSEKSRLSLHVLSGFAASSQSCPKWLATAFWQGFRDNRSRELRGFTIAAESYREPQVSFLKTCAVSSKSMNVSIPWCGILRSIIFAEQKLFGQIHCEPTVPQKRFKWIKVSFDTFLEFRCEKWHNV